jgi:prefoldin subunit 5
MEIQLNLVDLNTAATIELRNVPGIGSKLADRIMAARPLSDLMDLRRISGVGPALFEQIKPYVTVLPSELPASQEEQLPDVPVPSDQPSSASEPEAPIPPLTVPAASAPDLAAPVQAAAAPPPPPANPEPANPAQPPNKGVTRAEMYGIAAASGVFAFILAVFFTIAFLGLINGGLRFVRLVEMNQLASQVNTIDTQATALSGEIDSLKTRLTTVEGLDGRVTSVEQDTRQLRKDVDTLSGSAQTLGKRIDDLSFQVDALVTRTGRFQSFLDSLRNLLNNLNQPEVP